MWVALLAQGNTEHRGDSFIDRFSSHRRLSLEPKVQFPQKLGTPRTTWRHLSRTAGVRRLLRRRILISHMLPRGLSSFLSFLSFIWRSLRRFDLIRSSVIRLANSGPGKAGGGGGGGEEEIIAREVLKVISTRDQYTGRYENGDHSCYTLVPRK